MSFILKEGAQQLEYFPKKASTTLTMNGLAQFDGSNGVITVCTAAPTRVAGILAKSAASTDSDFASTTKIPVVVPQETNKFLADVTGTLLTTHVGVRFAPDATGQYVDIANTTTPVITVTDYISASKALVKISGAYVYKNA